MQSKQSYWRQRGDAQFLLTQRNSTTGVVTRCQGIPDLSIPQLCQLVLDGSNPQYIHLQHELLHRAMQRFLGGKEPHRQQVGALQQLVYQMGDTLLVAQTGFSKSITFHAYSVLTGCITIQLIPLSKLGEEQVQLIHQLLGTKPCLVIADTKLRNPQLLNEIKSGTYTHILLGPEQAVSPEFQKVLQELSFQRQVGLVAIDECHVLAQWKEFCNVYTLIHKLRRSLITSTVFFGCSATLDAESERVVQSSGGFRPEGIEPGMLEVIRTSVDRPEISICITPLLQKKQSSYEQLFFILSQAVNPGAVPSPEQIQKTIVFIDGRAHISSVAKWLKESLVQLGYSVTLAHQTIGIYTAHVPKFDQDRLYRKFHAEDSRIWVMVATTALGMGMDIPDIYTVVQWNFPITGSIGNLWQRFGCAARGPGKTGLAVFFVPYWALDHLGREKEQLSQELKPAALYQSRSKHRHNMLHCNRQASQLQESVVYSSSEGSDQDSSGEVPNQSTLDSWMSTRSQPLRSQAPVWSQREIQNRELLESSWKTILNSTVAEMNVRCM